MSLRNQTFADHEVILVDNNSTDDSVVHVNSHYPEVKLIPLNQNLGFTGACNAGYDVAQGEFILLLNNDTEADPEWLGAMIRTFRRHPKVGIVASKIMLYDQRDHFHAAGDYYLKCGIPGNRGVWQRDEGQYGLEEPVFAACGAAAAYRRTLVEDIGFLDDDFFFSCEDVDMAWRAHLAGWQVLYAPSAIVFHKLKATGGSITGSYYDGRNFLYLLWKDYPSSLLRRNWSLILRSQFNITWQALRAWRGPAARARLRGQFAGLLGIFTMLPKRNQIQANRRIPDEQLTAMLTSVDEVSPGK